MALSLSPQQLVQVTTCDTQSSQTILTGHSPSVCPSVYQV